MTGNVLCLEVNLSGRLHCPSTTLHTLQYNFDQAQAKFDLTNTRKYPVSGCYYEPCPVNIFLCEPTYQVEVPKRGQFWDTGGHPDW